MYAEWWKIYLSSHTNLNSFENIHFILMHVMNQIIKNILKNIDKSDSKYLLIMVNELKLIGLFYKQLVIPLNNDLNLLPKKLEQNYVMDRLFDIYSHIIKHIITSNFYGALIKTIHFEILSKNTGALNNLGNQNTIIYRTITNFLQFKYQNQTLEEFLFDTYTSAVIKITLGWFKDGDLDEKLSVDILNENITNFFINNPVLITSKESTLFKNVTERIIPFYKYVYTLSITNLEQMTNIYQRYLYNDDMYLKHMSLFLKKKIIKEHD